MIICPQGSPTILLFLLTLVATELYITTEQRALMLSEGERVMTGYSAPYTLYIFLLETDFSCICFHTGTDKNFSVPSDSEFDIYSSFILHRECFPVFLCSIHKFDSSISPLTSLLSPLSPLPTEPHSPTSLAHVPTSTQHAHHQN